MVIETKRLGYLQETTVLRITQYNRKILWASLLLLIVTIPIHSATASIHPNMYIDVEEIAAIKTKVVAAEQPWKNAYDKMISDAQQALNEGEYSVTFQGRTSHTFYSESPYCGWSRVDGGVDCRDGQINPQADRGDYNAAIKLSRAMRNLGLAYAFTENSAYAEKAISLIRTWSLNPDTYMVPGDKSGGGGLIELLITIPGLFYGADLVWNYQEWDPVEKSAFTEWVKTYGYYIKNKGVGANNFANWKNVLVSSAGAFLGDVNLLNFAFDSYKALIPFQISGAGKMEEEFTRTTGLSYSLYAINAMTQTAEIARHWGTDLFSYKTGNGRGLELALDYHVGFARNPSSWPYEQIKAVTGPEASAYELAYSFYQKPEYLTVVNAWGRPMEEKRIMGPVTLSHGNRFQLVLTPTPPSFIEQPASVLVDEGEGAVFNVVANGSAPLAYQWRRNGVAITGAASANYMVTKAQLSDNGAVYDCLVSNPEGSIVSDKVILSVNTDTLLPELVVAVATSPSSINVGFSENVEVSSAETVSNYSVDDGVSVVSILSAALSADGRNVRLAVSPMTEGTLYSLTVSNVQDMAENGNIISPMSSVQFTYAASDGFEAGNADGWMPATPTRWSIALDEGDSAYFLNTTGFSSQSGGRLGEYSLLDVSYADFTFIAQAKLGDQISSNSLADYAVVFGFQDENNYYFVMFNNDQSATQLFKVVNGSRIELATATTDWLNDNRYHLIQVSRTGNDIIVKFDDNLVMSASDGSLGSGKIGVGSYNDSAYFDDVSVTNTTSGGSSSGGGTSGGGSSGGGSTGGGTSSGGTSGGGSTGGDTSGGGTSGGGSTGGDTSGGDTSGGGSTGGGSQGPLGLFFMALLMLALRGHARDTARLFG
ncbi:MAG: hypothetical protein GXP17_04745 [Gammaproteobacteria bacterium]|nr:hypothetical protein [Gammaproteobacteria bacterium]